MKIYATFKTLTFTAALFTTAFSSPLTYAEPLTAKEIQKRQNAKTKLPRPKVGRAVAEAFELYKKDDAQGAIELLLSLSPKNAYDQAFINKFVGNVYATIEGQTELAIKYILKAQEPDVLNYKEQLEVLNLLATLSMLDKQYQNAIDWYDIYADYGGSRNGKIYERIASAYFELGQFENILAPAEKAIKLSDGKNEHAYTLKMAALKQTKDFVGAAQTALNLAEISDKKVKNTAIAAELYYLAGQEQKAFDVLHSIKKQKLMVNPSDLIRYAFTFAELGQAQKCIDLLQQYLNDGKILDDESYYYITGKCNEKLGSYTLAAKSYESASKLDDNKAYLVDQGRALVKADNYQVAVKVLKKSLESEKSNGEAAKLYLAQAYYHLNDLIESKTYLDQVAATTDMDLKPQVEELQLKLAKTKG